MPKKSCTFARKTCKKGKGKYLLALAKKDEKHGGVNNEQGSNLKNYNDKIRLRNCLLTKQTK
jgi:hypothetical protein